MTEITLRKATPLDMKLVYDLRNAPETRQYSFTSQSISWETHVTWYHNTLLNQDKILLIGQLGNTIIGVLRYDLLNNTDAKINVFLATVCHGKGLGTQLLRAGIAWANQNTSLKNIKAEIIPENIASLKAFTKAGFQEAYHVYEFKIRENSE